MNLLIYITHTHNIYIHMLIYAYVDTCAGTHTDVCPGYYIDKSSKKPARW